MSTLLVRTRSIPHISLRSGIALSLALITAAFTTAGLVSPWVTVFNGLSSVPGSSLDGGYLAAVTAISCATLYVMATSGGGNILRSVAVLGGAVVVADSLLSAARISEFVAHPGVAGTLTVPSAGPGPFFTLVGGIALIATALTAPAAQARLGRGMLLRLLLSVSLIVAADLHLIFTPQHFDEAPLLGVGFLAAGLVQLAFAVYVIVREDDRPIGLLLAVTIALIAIYAYAIFVGLPLDSGHSDAATGLRLGSGEPVTTTGLIDVLAEIAAVALAIVAYPGLSRAQHVS
jgi:hypothetical protein